MNYTYRQIWSVTFPIIISVLTEQLINITDAIFLGHVGETELGASAIAGIYYLAIYMLGFGFSIGLQVMIARKNGERNYKDTGRIFFMGLYLLIVLSVFLFSISKFVSPFILQKLINSEEIYMAVMKYVNWRCFGLLFAFPLLALRSFYIGITKTKILSISAFIMVFINILLNWLLIFSAGLGISGAAIASTLSEAIALLIIVGYTVFKIDKQSYGIRPVFDIKILSHLLQLSVWSMFHSFISVAPWFLFFIAIEQHLGKNQLAIANILRSISTLFFVIVNSLGTATSSLVSNLIGAGESRNVMPLCYKVIRFGYILGTPLIIIALIFSTKILSVYTSNNTLIINTILPYIVMLSNYFMAVPAYVLCNAVTGTGNTKMGFIFQVVTIVCYLMYLWLLNIISNVSLAVYWTAEHLFVILLFIFSFIYMKSGKWYNRKL